MLYSLDPLRKDPHGPEAYGISGSIKLPQPKAARDHCTPAHRTSYQVGRVRLSPPASPQPTALALLMPKSQASREKHPLPAKSNGLATVSSPIRHSTKRSAGECRHGGPLSMLSPASSSASSITRTLTFCNPRQRKIPLSPALPGLACRGRIPRFLPAPQSNLLRAALRAKRGESQTVSKSLTAGWHRRVEAESLDSPSPSLFALDSLRSAHPLTEAIRRDRSKSEQSVCTQTNRKLLLAVMPHDRQPSFNEQFRIAN